MSKRNDGAGEAQEPRATYRVPKRVKNRRAIERAIRIQDELFERHAGESGVAPDSVQIIRAWRDRG